MKKLTFKQFLESKEQLLKAIENTPTTILEYNIKKYCTLYIGEEESERQPICLKPKQQIIVEWRYDDINNPTPQSIQFVGLSSLNEDDKYSTYWTGKKLQTWLTRHAEQGVNYGHKF